jgi:hypothetical protein
MLNTTASGIVLSLRNILPGAARLAGAALQSWQVRGTLLIGGLGPPVASFIVLLVTCFGRHSQPVDVPGFAVVYLVFAVPVGYAFGIVPALFAGVMYCSALTAVATLQRSTLLGVCVGAASGGLIGEAWFHLMIGSDARIYGWTAALVAGLLSSSAGPEHYPSLVGREADHERAPPRPPGPQSTLQRQRQPSVHDADPSLLRSGRAS